MSIMVYLVLAIKYLSPSPCSTAALLDSVNCRFIATSCRLYHRKYSSSLSIWEIHQIFDAVESWITRLSYLELILFDSIWLSWPGGAGPDSLNGNSKYGRTAVAAAATAPVASLCCSLRLGRAPRWARYRACWRSGGLPWELLVLASPANCFATPHRYSASLLSRLRSTSTPTGASDGHLRRNAGRSILGGRAAIRPRPPRPPGP
jgi:hypothetical protein